jgi:hypothetical protein
MAKHRGPILEHQTSRPASLSDFFMENATNSQKLACSSTARMPQPPQAMVDLGLELGNKRFLGQGAVWGDVIFFEISLI